MDTEGLEFLKGSLRILWKAIEEYKSLYDDSNLPLLKRAATDFFGWHQKLCWDYFILSVSRLLDEKNGTLSIVTFHLQNRASLSPAESKHVDQLLRRLRQEKQNFEKARGSFIAHRSVRAIKKKIEIPLQLKDVEVLWSEMEAALKAYDPSGPYRVSVMTGAKALLRYLNRVPARA